MVQAIGGLATIDGLKGVMSLHYGPLPSIVVDFDLNLRKLALTGLDNSLTAFLKLDCLAAG
ncbi:hypothetical protein ANO14919_091010 [Xylariales sp. No.14919]|nr:hypothetical protein ANO14919_091010 [Xylariales sp. No.14919]